MQHRRPTLHAPLFAEDFDQPAVHGVTVLDDAADAPREIPAATQAEIALARDEAYAEGLCSGLAQAAADRAEVSRQMLATIADRLAHAAGEARQVAEDAAHSLARLLLGTLAAVLPATCARHGATEVAALARTLLPALAQEPRVTIRISPHVTEALQAELAQLDAMVASRIVVVPTDAVVPGDVRISWDDGVAMRDTAALWQQVSEVLAPLGLLPAAEPAIRELVHT
jgi:flagellar assembly protein FliH